MARGKRLQFPQPTEVTEENPVAWRNSQDLVKLANHASDWEYKNLCQAVMNWVRSEAEAAGWTNVYFPLAYPSRTLRSGAVFEK